MKKYVLVGALLLVSYTFAKLPPVMFVAKGPSKQYPTVETMQPVLQPALYVLQEKGEPLSKGAVTTCDITTRETVIEQKDGQDARVWEMIFYCEGNRVYVVKGIEFQN